MKASNHRILAFLAIFLFVSFAGAGLYAQTGKISGRVIDETRNTFLIETRSGDKRVPKSCNCFIFTLSQGLKVKAEGSVLVSQPENRINKRIRRSRWKL